MDPKPKWDWKTLVINLVVVVVIFNLGYFSASAPDHARQRRHSKGYTLADVEAAFRR